MEDNYNNQQPEVVQTGGPNGPTQQSNAIGVTGLVTGIIGVILAVCCYPLGILLGIVALICGFIAKGKNQKYAVAGIVLGSVSIGLALLVIILGAIGASFLQNYDWEQFIRELEQAQ